MPESGGRSFEENQEFFKEAEERGSWRVGRVKGGEWLGMPVQEKGEREGESQPLLAGLVGGSSLP